MEKILSELKERPFVKLEQDELDKFLSGVKTIREEDTYLCDIIRIVEYEGKILVQEKTDKNEILIRAMSSLEEAEKFIKERMDFYERKWDGCGCKVDYYR